MPTQSFVASGRSFNGVFDHAQVIVEMHYEACRGKNKRPRYQGGFSESRRS